MRLIDADCILSALNVFSDREHGNEHFLSGIETAREIVKDAPTIEPKSQWIPVTEKPAPDVYRDKEGLLIPFLISQTRCKYPTIAFYSNGNWNLGIDIVEVEAWMPLPSVYKPKDKEE